MAAKKNVQIIHATAPLPDIVRVAPYVRVSSLSDDQLHSFHLQYSHYHRLVTNTKGWALVDVYADEGLTGTRADKREDFKRLMRDCWAGKIDRVIVKSVSRFARNVEDCLDNIRQLKALGVSVYFEEEDIDTAHMTDEMILSIRSVQAQQESMVNSRNANWSYQERMRQGKFITYHAPIGYIRVDGKLVVDERTAPVVRRIFDEYLSGKGKQAIANALNRDAIPTSEGGPWHGTSVEYVLKNEKYIGDALLQKHYTTDSLPFKEKRNQGERPQYYVEASHEPIISKDKYYRAQELFQWRNRFDRKKASSQYPLTQKLKCENCGTTFRRKVSTNGIISWECLKRNRHGVDSCPVANVKEDEVYEAFITLYNRLKKRKGEILSPMLKYMEQAYTMGEDIPQETVLINARIAEVSKKLARLNGLAEKGVLSDALLAKNRAPLERELYELRQEKKRLQVRDDPEEIKELRSLIRVIEAGPEIMMEFNAILFNNMVHFISVAKEDFLTFHLIGGLALKETIQRRTGR